MRVALLSTLERGGPLEQALVLAPALAALGVEVRVGCAGSVVADRFRAQGVEAHPVATGRAAGRLARGAELVHGLDRRAGLWTRLRPRRSGARIYTVHGLPDPYLPGARPALRDRLAYEGLDAALCRRAERVIVPSHAMAELFVDRLRFPRERLAVVPNGVEVPVAALSPGPAVGTLSVLEPVKGLDVLLRAIARLASAYPETEWVLFGEGSARAALRRLADELGVADRVDFPGHVDRREGLSRLGLLVLPSRMENAPLGLLEAMAGGIPAVASRVGGIPELAPEGTVALVPPEDPEALAAAIAHILDDPAAAREQATRAREHVAANFSAEANARAVHTVYREALATP